MDNGDVTPVSIATAAMRGWWVEMRAASFLLCGPAAPREERRAYFERCRLGYRFPAADVEAAWESLREASRWFRGHWRPDFALPHPFGLDRRVQARRVGEWIELQCTAFTETEPEEASLEFTYTELPGLRAGLARRARPGRKRLMKDGHGDPRN